MIWSICPTLYFIGFLEPKAIYSVLKEPMGETKVTVAFLVSSYPHSRLVQFQVVSHRLLAISQQLNAL